MRRTGRTPIEDNAAYGDLDKPYGQVIYGQFLIKYSKYVDIIMGFT